MEIARQRRAEQARLAKLEEQRVEYLDRKLAQAEPRNPISEEASAFHAFIEWARPRLKKMDA
ncbi:hypothetical protein [Mesorhizobium sp.]|uniref:hypothetical protein n=1 Tax=Mesorhizobium sp. TaxID=1871066 RepID=UPI0011FF3A17|nr:hypothetical protein [Mesorhizobium sp.]TIN29769.1 MAG: hypothetical protein E5Y19_03370 [Mesorhizobium sp.]TJU90164.1 MAG: hypothetical protein E5Y15_03430 [Mesorhizobium sp.]